MKHYELLDAKDPLKCFRDLFSLPEGKIYLCSHSLGLPAKSAQGQMQEEITRWSQLGNHGWFSGEKNWYSSFEAPLKKGLAYLLGAFEEEVAVMNSLTVNLHLLLTSFFQPTKERYKIIMDAPTFSSDLFAVKSHLERHGLGQEALILLKPRPNEFLLRQEDIEELLVKEGKRAACLFFSAVNFLTGQVYDLEKIVHLAKEQGMVVGLDLAHGVGNIVLKIHEWKVDFAVGCSYKYLSSGPGGPGFAYVHKVHHEKSFPRLSGWWGNDPKTRFDMHVNHEFVPYGGASSWQISTPSILSQLPFRESLKLYKEAGMEKIRQKSQLQTAFARELLLPFFKIVTPCEAESYGCQLSFHIENAKEYVPKLEALGIFVDFRPPSILRVSFSPLYNTFSEIYHFATLISKLR